MFSLHTDKNIFNIFPSIPVFEDERSIDLYLPPLDGETLLKEKRIVQKFDSEERYISYLFNEVVKGSEFINTSMAVPLNMLVRKVWVHSSDGSNLCVIDVRYSIRNSNVEITPGSEMLFKKAISKTVLENVPKINRVIILVQGIPNRPLWEI